MNRVNAGHPGSGQESKALTKLTAQWLGNYCDSVAIIEEELRVPGVQLLEEAKLNKAIAENLAKVRA